MLLNSIFDLLLSGTREVRIADMLIVCDPAGHDYRGHARYGVSIYAPNGVIVDSCFIGQWDTAIDNLAIMLKNVGLLR